MWRFLARWRRLLTAAAVPLLALLSFTAASRAPDLASWPGALAATAAEPVQTASTAVFSLLSDAGATLFSGPGLRRENVRLREELARLRGELQAVRERAAEAERLERLLDYRGRTGLKSTAASVIGRDAGNLFRSVLIDKGTADGVERNHGVLTPEGAVGRVVKVYPRSALVLLLVDRSSGIDALVQRTRDQGIVQGLGGGVCGLKYLSREAEVALGDTVVTSGMDGVFPKGVEIGQVSRVEKGGQFFQSVEVTPAAELERLEEVLVLALPAEARP